MQRLEPIGYDGDGEGAMGWEESQALIAGVFGRATLPEVILVHDWRTLTSSLPYIALDGLVYSDGFAWGGRAGRCGAVGQSMCAALGDTERSLRGGRGAERGAREEADPPGEPALAAAVPAGPVGGGSEAVM